MSKNIRLNCTVTEFKTERNKTRVEDYGSKKNELKIEEGIMEIKAFDATPNMEIPILSEQQIKQMRENYKRRITPWALRIKNMENNNIQQTPNRNGTFINRSNSVSQERN